MKVSVLLFFALFALSGAVTVTVRTSLTKAAARSPKFTRNGNSCSLLQEGDFHFPLESVKALRTLFTEDEASADWSLQEMETKAEAMCSHPELLAEFRSLCLRSDAGASMARLGKNAALKLCCRKSSGFTQCDVSEPAGTFLTPENQV